MNERERDVALVVDDTPGSLSFLTDALEDAGYSVLVATDGDAALALTQRVTPDVVLMDAVMPGRDGFQTCQALKARDSFQHVPVIFMTGLTETEHVIMGLSAGGVDYVTKPIVAEELIARIRVHVANARMTSGVRIALDAAGRRLFAVSRRGDLLWTTSRAGAPLDLLLEPGTGTGDQRLPEAWMPWLADCLAAEENAAPPPLPIAATAATPAWTLSLVIRLNANEVLLRLDEAEGQDDTRRIRETLGLTKREAEVLLWVARGKTNRDIATILTLSPRTVDKHLEQVYTKLGVENRAAAIGLALRSIL